MEKKPNIKKLFSLFPEDSSSSTIFTIGSGSESPRTAGDRHSSDEDESGDDVDDIVEETKAVAKVEEEEEDDWRKLQKMMTFMTEIFLPFKGKHQDSTKPKKNRALTALIIICRCFCCWLCLLLAFALLWLILYLAIEEHVEDTRFWNEFEDIAVATDNKMCAVVGRDVVKSGGSVVDGAIAAMLCNGVSSLHSTGLGGGFFMTYYNRTQRRAYVIDALGTSPLHSSLSEREGALLTVPAELSGYFLAHYNFGRLNWKYLLEPAIKMCNDGIAITPKTAEIITKYKKELHKMTGFRDVYFDKHDKYKSLRREGELVSLPKLRDTLKSIALRGIDDFYEGPIGYDYVKDVKRKGGFLRMNDFQRYSAKMREPATFPIQPALTMYSSSFPASGNILGYAISILDKFNYASIARSSANLEGIYHNIAEALKHSFVQWLNLGDPATADFSDLTEKLTNEMEILRVSKLINDRSQAREIYGEDIPSTMTVDEGSSSVCIIGMEGDAIALTSSINSRFGAEFISLSTGINTNNFMKTFSSEENKDGINNLLEPRKRPRSSLCPSIFTNENGDVVLAISAGGGPSSLAAITLAVVYLYTLEANLSEAITASRIHHQLVPNVLWYEYNLDDFIVNKLADRGHTMEIKDFSDTRIVAVMRTNENKFIAAYDPRGEGSVSGYTKRSVHKKKKSKLHKITRT